MPESCKIWRRRARAGCHTPGVDITLRPVTHEELPDFYRADSTAFGDIATERDIAEWRWSLGLDLDRSIAAFDGDHIVGAAAALDFELTIPGRVSIPCAGITMVGVLPTHRRRGILTRMMRMQLDDVCRRGEPVAALLASESVIYGRFGYGAATFAANWTLPTEGTLFEFPPAPTGRLRLIDDAEAASVVPRLYERARRQTVGEVTRAAELWAHEFERPIREGERRPFTLVHESPSGEPDGFARYKIDSAWTEGRANSTLNIIDLYSDDAGIEAALFEFLVSIDLVTTVKGGFRPLDEALRWRLADPRRLQITQVTDRLWVRIVDPLATLSARRYASDDRLVIELTDAFLPANGGCFVVEGSPDSAHASRTDAPADLAMSTNELGSLYLGGVAATALARADRIRELTPGAIERADHFFATAPAPWCGSDF